MREQMPTVAAIIDDLRSGFGAEFIDNIIKRGVLGEPVFFASENGQSVGTPVPVGVRVGFDERGNRCLLDGPIAGEEVQHESKFSARERREKLKGVR